MLCLIYCIVSGFLNVLFLQFYVGLAIFCCYNLKYALRLVFNYAVLMTYTFILTIYCLLTCFDHSKFLKMVSRTFHIAESVLGINVDAHVSDRVRGRINALQDDGKVRRRIIQNCNQRKRNFQGFVVILNHQSIIHDMMVVYKVSLILGTPICVVAARILGLLYLPLRMVLHASRTVFTDVNDTANTIEKINAAALRADTEGSAIFIYPEGEINYDHDEYSKFITQADQRSLLYFVFVSADLMLFKHHSDCVWTYRLLAHL